MAVRKKRAVFKTMLLAPGGTLFAWGLQNAIRGEPYVAAVASVVGLAMIAGFVVLQERDIPYEEEIAEFLEEEYSDVTSEEIADALKGGSEDVAEHLEENVDPEELADSIEDAVDSETQE